MGVKYVYCSPANAAAGDAAWNDAATAITAPLFQPVPSITKQKFDRIMGDVRSNVAKAHRGLKMIEKGLQDPTRRPAHYAKASQLFADYFGQCDLITVQAVIQRYDYIRQGLSQDILVRHVTPQPAGRQGTKASVRTAHKATAPGAGDFTPRIKFYDKLISGQFAVLGANSMWGSLLHEMSHLFLGTSDHAYKPSRIKALTAAQQISNADQYKYFTELWQYQSLGVGEQKVDAVG